MNKLTVRKNQAQRYSFRLILLLISIMLILILLWNEYPLLLIFIPLEIIFGVILIYIESWQILFLSNFIEKKCFFLTMGRYSYSEIIDVSLSYSATDHEYVVLNFAKHKQISFRLKDVNASKALKIIRSHKSITLKNNL